MLVYGEISGEARVLGAVRERPFEGLEKWGLPRRDAHGGESAQKTTRDAG